MNLTERDRERLLALGYQYAPEALGKSGKALDEAMILEWQKFHSKDMEIGVRKMHMRDFQMDGDFGPATAASMWQMRCAFPDFRSPDQPHVLGAVLEGNWPVGCRNELTWDHIITTLKGLSAAEVENELTAAFQNLMNDLQVTFERRRGAYPNVRFAERSKNLGGGGILAQHLLAYNNCGGSTWGEFNTAVTWPSGMYFRTTATHEFGHGLGMDHVPQDNTATMYPSINSAAISRGGRFNSTDFAEAIKKGYSKRVGDPPTPEPPDPTPGVVTFTSSLVEGQVVRLGDRLFVVSNGKVVG